MSFKFTHNQVLMPLHRLLFASSYSLALAMAVPCMNGLVLLNQEEVALTLCSLSKS